jgi:hypothetical protein
MRLRCVLLSTLTPLFSRAYRVFARFRCVHLYTPKIFAGLALRVLGGAAKKIERAGVREIILGNYIVNFPSIHQYQTRFRQQLSPRKIPDNRNHCSWEKHP